MSQVKKSGYQTQLDCLQRCHSKTQRCLEASSKIIASLPEHDGIG